jgi:hypothetical protein
MCVHLLFVNQSPHFCGLSIIRFEVECDASPHEHVAVVGDGEELGMFPRPTCSTLVGNVVNYEAWRRAIALMMLGAAGKISMKVGGV